MQSGVQNEKEGKANIKLDFGSSSNFQVPAIIRKTSLASHAVSLSTMKETNKLHFVPKKAVSNNEN